MTTRFYVCKHCGNVIVKTTDSGVPVVCCGEKMEELIPGTSDGAFEKHVPVYTIDNNIVKVNVGEVDHPMLTNHYIMWIAVKTNEGLLIKHLEPGMAPKACFALSEKEEVEAVYAYCNLHSLWKA